MSRLQNRTPEGLQNQLKKALALRAMGVITRGLLLTTLCPGCGQFGAMFSLHSGSGFHHDKNCLWHGKLRDPGVLEKLIELSLAIKATHPQLPEHR